MDKNKINMLFLGDRLIADGVLRIYLDTYRSDNFSIAGVVSSKQFFNVHSDALGGDVKFISNETRNTESLKKLIVDHSVNMLLSVQHNWILNSDILSLVDGFCFNLHNAKLPDYKGYNCVSHAIYNGDLEYVSTIHWMDKDVDCGYIAYEEITKISNCDTAKSLYEKTICSSMVAAESLFKNIESGLKPPKIRKVEKNDGKFYDRDSIKKLFEVKFSDSDEEISRRVRSSYFPPYNNAYSIVNGMRVDLMPNVGINNEK